MSAEPDVSRSEFRCPVCRAAQILQDTCRRCQADLRLVVGAHRRWAYLQQQQQRTETAPADDEYQERIAAELRWLAPRR